MCSGSEKWVEICCSGVNPSKDFVIFGTYPPVFLRDA